MITEKISLGQAGIFSCSLLLFVDTRDKHRGDAVSTMHWDFKPVGDCSTQSKEKLPTTLLFQTDFHIIIGCTLLHPMFSLKGFQI